MLEKEGERLAQVIIVRRAPEGHFTLSSWKRLTLMRLWMLVTILLRPHRDEVPVSTRAWQQCLKAVTIAFMEVLRENGQNGQQGHPEVFP